ncbi:MAG: tRNA (adenosine(37)-N6)-threonylcarbamoyltransferase complex transferase subunit TsaD [bacterium]|nr:tRNA (adenosine(37)-N6)-threonylcarbamoyltransferase complex transferase subunit TsaD [bacterium]MDO8742551.1 tRNA (adenosine(37)-N6)-threonylcarbamoyltransferase complex transferase subunit TsaD [bacterium]
MTAAKDFRILGIETSCDETAIAILECKGDEKYAEFTVLGNALLSQIDIHKEYGGVFPALAKREHAKNLVPILEAVLEEAELLREDTQIITEETRNKLSEILAREPGLSEAFFEFISECEPPEIDVIAVTAGPGLEPALWVGINFAHALAFVWNKPLIAVNHMEGHLLSALAQNENGVLTITKTNLPVLGLLISGGHTELVVMNEWLKYELVGETRDDAVGEAFDKVARMLNLPYPGGPEISRLAETTRNVSSETLFKLPRPMIDSGTCDFSFAGLKTAVLNLLKTKEGLTDEEKRHIAHEFENAVADVLWKKTSLAIEETGAQTLVIGGGVSANTHIRRVFTEKIKSEHSDIALHIPSAALTTDNAIMIAMAGYFRAQRKEFVTAISANGNLPLA